MELALIGQCGTFLLVAPFFFFTIEWKTFTWWILNRNVMFRNQGPVCVEDILWINQLTNTNQFVIVLTLLWSGFCSSTRWDCLDYSCPASCCGQLTPLYTPAVSVAQVLLFYSLINIKHPSRKQYLNTSEFTRISSSKTAKDGAWGRMDILTVG